jgi:uncharacterized protein YdaU (DUF1376 family)
MPLYTGDYLRDTRHLSMSEHGAYNLALMFCWDSKGPMPIDERKQFAIVCARSTDEMEAWRRVRDEFFVRMEDGWYQGRLMREIERCESISGARSTAGRAGANARMQRLRERQANAKQMPSNCSATVEQVTLSPSPYPDKDSVAKATGTDAPAETIFALGVPMLTSAGVVERNARSFLGMLRKHNHDAEVIAALQRCAEARAVAPVEFLQGCLRVTSLKAKETPYERSKRDLAQKWMGSVAVASNVVEMEVQNAGKPALGR